MFGLRVEKLIESLSGNTSLKIYELEEIHHKTQRNRGTTFPPLFPRASGRGASPFLSLFAPRIVQWSDNARGRSAGGQFVWMDNDTGRPRTMAASACQGHKSISRKRSKVAKLHWSERNGGAPRFSQFTRPLLHLPSTPSTILQESEGGEKNKKVHGSTSFEREYFRNISLVRNISAFCCLDVGGCFFEGWIVSTLYRVGQISKVIIHLRISRPRCTIIYYRTWKFSLEPYKISGNNRQEGNKVSVHSSSKILLHRFNVRTDKKKKKKRERREKKQKKRECDNERIETIAPAAIRILVTVFRNRF